MKPENPTHKLEETKFEQLLTILKNEQEANALSHRQKVLIFLFSFCFYGFLIGMILYTPILGITEGSKSQLWSSVSSVLAVVVLLFVPSALILFFLNIPLIVKIIKQRKLMSRLGLSEIFSKRWRARHWKRRFLNIFSFIGILLGLIWVYTGMRFLNMERGIALYLIFLGVGVFIITISNHFVRLGKERLDFLADLDRLKESLLRDKASAEQAAANLVEVRSDDLDSIAQIERAQIARSREKAIETFKESDASDYLLQKNLNMLNEINQLDIHTRLRVEEQIERLITEPRPKDSERDHKSENWNLRVPETSYGIVYNVNDTQQLIRILSLQSLTDTALPDQGEGDS